MESRVCIIAVPCSGNVPGGGHTPHGGLPLDPPTVQVYIPVPGADIGCIVSVDCALAIVVYTVADLDSIRMNSGIVVVTIPAGGHMIRGCYAGLIGLGIVPEAVRVRIRVPGGQQTVIHVPIAVVVYAIADLSGPRVGRRLRVVTVHVLREAISVRIDKLHTAGLRYRVLRVLSTPDESQKKETENTHCDLARDSGRTTSPRTAIRHSRTRGSRILHCSYNHSIPLAGWKFQTRSYGWCR